MERIRAIYSTQTAVDVSEDPILVDTINELKSSEYGEIIRSSDDDKWKGKEWIGFLTAGENVYAIMPEDHQKAEMCVEDARKLLTSFNLLFESEVETNTESLDKNEFKNTIKKNFAKLESHIDSEINIMARDKIFDDQKPIEKEILEIYDEIKKIMLSSEAESTKDLHKRINKLRETIIDDVGLDRENILDIEDSDDYHMLMETLILEINKGIVLRFSKPDGLDFALMFPMWYFFEKIMDNSLKHWFTKEKGFKCTEHQKIICIIYEDGKNEYAYPDCILEKNGKKIVFDAKYTKKVTSDYLRLSRYQILTYMGVIPANRGVLVLPAGSEVDRLGWVARNNAKFYGHRYYITHLDWRDPGKSYEEFKKIVDG